MTKWPRKIRNIEKKCVNWRLLQVLVEEIETKVNSASGNVKMSKSLLLISVKSDNYYSIKNVPNLAELAR